MLFACCGYPVWLLSGYQSSANAQELRRIALTPTYDYVRIYVDSYSTAIASAFPSVTVVPTLDITASPYPTERVATPTMGVLEKYSLSFYDPHIGFYFPEIASINCLIWDITLRDCVSKVHKGIDVYSLWYGKGLACPEPKDIDKVFYVISPKEVAGEWKCIDTGDLYRNGRRYLDFMLRYPDDVWSGYNLNNFPWSEDVIVWIGG